MKPLYQVLTEPDAEAELVRSLLDYAQNGYGFTDDIGANTSNEVLAMRALEAAYEAATERGVPVEHPAVDIALNRLMALGMDHREGLTVAGVKACYAHYEEPSLEALGLAP